MANWLNQDFRFGNEIIPSIPANSPLAAQGQALVNEIQSAQQNGYILMGHSQGGLISRWAAQYFQTYNPLSLSGVISVDTPHFGANLATTLPAEISGILVREGASMYATLGCVTPYDTPACFMASLAIVGGADFDLALTAIQPSIADLQPGSNFLTNLNSTPETFNRAAVIGYTNQRWAVTRVMSEFIYGFAWQLSSGKTGPEPCNPEDSCGERAVAQATEVFYDVVEVATVVDVIFGFFDPDAWALLPYLLETLFWMDAIDLSYDLLVDFPGDGSSDGMVQGPSQIYPGAAAVQYPIYGADSHSAALRSPYDHPVLDTILANQFHVPTQASCAFGSSVSAFSPSALATLGSISVSSPAGCQWSATSQAPWLSITSGINGITNGAVDFSVQANPSTVPRQGSIQVGNGLSNTSFTVFQAGVCTYTFSPGPVIASPAAGESSQVTISTETNCPWSIETATSWLAITSGTTGTGTGSFTFTASPNTLSADRSGLITLMGQTLGATLAVIDGSPVGTPGVATVTITGAPRSATYNPCASMHLSCPITVPEIGSVSITVAGDTFEVNYPISGYPTTTTSGMLASALASQMNQPLSPVAATVSGSTISITSTINGSATNYSLTPSFTFNEDCGLGAC